MPRSRGAARWVKLVRRLTATLAPVMAILLIIAMPGAGSVASASASVDASGHHRPPVPADRLVPFQWQVPGKAPAPKPFRHYDPRADSRLPRPGSATVRVPGATRGRSAAVLMQAGTLPVSVGETRAATMTVHVAAQRTAQAAGVHGVLFTVASTQPGSATVAVDDSSFAAAFGGDYAARLSSSPRRSRGTARRCGWTA
jgi:hypothetical protein